MTCSKPWCTTGRPVPVQTVVLARREPFLTFDGTSLGFKVEACTLMCCSWRRRIMWVPWVCHAMYAMCEAQGMPSGPAWKFVIGVHVGACAGS